jgi:hypothetical protein
MRKAGVALLAFCLIAAALVPAALAEGGDYLGRWVSVAVDWGDGVKLTEFDGQDISELESIEFKEDGTFVQNFMGDVLDGTSWAERPGGVSISFGLDPTPLDMVNGQLVDVTSGVRIYLKKVEGAAGEGFSGRWIATGGEAGDGSIQPLEGAMTLMIQFGGTLSFLWKGRRVYFERADQT